MKSHLARVIQDDKELVGLRRIFDDAYMQTQAARLGFQDPAQLRLAYLRYKPFRRCTALFQSTASLTSDCMVVTALTERGYYRRLAKSRLHHSHLLADDSTRLQMQGFPFDVELRRIGAFYRPDSRSRLLRRLFGRGSCHCATQAQLLAYKPSKRLVVCGRHHQQSLHTLKFYSPHAFPTVWQSLHALSQTSNWSSKILAAHQRYAAVALEWIPGSCLADELDFSSMHSRALLSEVGAQLAAMHDAHSNIAWHTNRLNPSTSPSALADYITRLAPSLSKPAGQLAQQIECLLPRLSRSDTIIHNDFYAKQVIVNDQEVRFIDFDQATVGDRHRDLGNFVAHLHWQSVNARTDPNELASGIDAFIAGYAKNSARLCLRTLQAFTADALFRLATHPFRRVLPNWPEMMTQLLQCSAQHLMAAESFGSPWNVQEVKYDGLRISAN